VKLFLKFHKLLLHSLEF